MSGARLKKPRHCHACLPGAGGARKSSDDRVAKDIGPGFQQYFQRYTWTFLRIEAAHYEMRGKILDGDTAGSSITIFSKWSESPRLRRLKTVPEAGGAGTERR